jgi:hypothetical protein
MHNLIHDVVISQMTNNEAEEVMLNCRVFNARRDCCGKPQCDLFEMVLAKSKDIIVAPLAAPLLLAVAWCGVDPDQRMEEPDIPLTHQKHHNTTVE